MIAKWIILSARYRVFTVLAVLAFALWGVWAMTKIPLDAVPDLSDTQVIIFTEWMGRSPDIVEAQVTYPIVSRLIATPGIARVRGQSMFGMSFVYLVFDEGVDLYWARSRVLEKLQAVAGKLPAGVTPTIGSDATAVGWVFQYALVDTTGKHDISDLTSLQDWTLRYGLEAVPGVAEVARMGGAVREYQVALDPNRLLALKIPISDIVMAIRMSNQEVGGGTLELSGHEFSIRGRGYLTSLSDLEKIPVGRASSGTPIYLKDVARLEVGPAPRRGIVEWEGKGEAVGGIVIIRPGQNTLSAIERIKAKIAEITPSLPEGVQIVVTYDRSDLILRAIDTLKHTLIEEMIAVSLVIIIFLGHFRSALIPLIGLPIAVLLAFIPMQAMGLSANIMSLSGIAIAIGAMVDATIIMVENASKKLSSADGVTLAGGGPLADGKLSKEERERIILAAFVEVGPSIFFALLVITVSFMPIFSLTAQEGKLFSPLAYTKTFSMAAAAILAITLTPAISFWFLCGRIPKEESNWLNRFLIKMYEPLVRAVLRHRIKVVVGAVVIVVGSFPLFWKLGNEFMPPLNEGVILYMPTSAPGISATEAERVLQILDRQLKAVPEVLSVFGKIGRAETPTDPSPLWMAEIVVTLKPQNEWVGTPTAGMRTPVGRPMKWEELIAKLDAAVGVPGMPNIWWMPIQTRTEMLATGIRSPVGVKVFGPDTDSIEKVAVAIEQTLRRMPQTASAVAERLSGGNFYDIKINRESVTRYGLTTGDVNDMIETAIGGSPITEIIDGRARYPVRVRYAREFREDPETLSRVLVPTQSGAQIPLSDLAQFKMVSGPPMLLSEGGQLLSLVFVDPGETPMADYVAQAKQAVAQEVKIPPGVRIEWSGQFAYYERAKERLAVVVPITLLLVVLLLYLNTQSMTATGIILLAVPFSVVGAVWFLYFLGYNLSIAVWVGLIALAGLDAETGSIMLLYLNLSHQKYIRAGSPDGIKGFDEAVVEGSAKRIRPKMMTVVAILVGLVPILWAEGAGADTMRRIAAPMIGGVITSLIMELLVYPAIFSLWRRPNE
jgi:Cu(I)/Ag(I) efflux system membrane protein CusA/SilA